MTIDPRIKASRALSDAITTYLQASKALTSASERATQTSTGIDGAARREAYQALTELGDKVRLAQRNITLIVQKAKKVLPPADIEAIAKKLDGRDSLDSVALLVKTALAG